MSFLLSFSIEFCWLFERIKNESPLNLKSKIEKFWIEFWFWFSKFSIRFPKEYVLKYYQFIWLKTNTSILSSEFLRVRFINAWIVVSEIAKISIWNLSLSMHTSRALNFLFSPSIEFENKWESLENSFNVFLKYVTFCFSCNTANWKWISFSKVEEIWRIIPFLERIRTFGISF